MKYYAVCEEIKAKKDKKFTAEKLPQKVADAQRLYIFENEEDANEVSYTIAQKNSGFHFPVFVITINENEIGEGITEEIAEDDRLIEGIKLKNAAFSIDPQRIKDFSVAILATAAEDPEEVNEGSSESVEEEPLPAENLSVNRKSLPSGIVPIPPIFWGIFPIFCGGAILSMPTLEQSMPGPAGLIKTLYLSFLVGAAALLASSVVTIVAQRGLNACYDLVRNYINRRKYAALEAKVTHDKEKKLVRKLRDKLDQLSHYLQTPENETTTYGEELVAAVTNLQEALREPTLEKRVLREKATLARVKNLKSRSS